MRSGHTDRRAGEVLADSVFPAALLSIGIGRTAADPGRREDELDAPGRIPVAGQGRDDRANLFVAGSQQERRCAAVALRSDDEDIRFLGMGEFLESMRWNRSAAVLAWINKGASRTGASMTGSRDWRSSRSGARSGR